MKTKINSYLLLSILICLSCEPESAPTLNNTEAVISSEASGTVESETNPNSNAGTHTGGQASDYPWKMVVNTVDSYNGIENDRAFIDILLGHTLSNGITTTNTTNFGLNYATNELNLKLQHYGWTLWEAYGFYPIEWDFHFIQTEDTFELEGFANVGLSNCEQSLTETIISNRFHFIGTLVDSSSKVLKYNGMYKWQETYPSGICISIEGNMSVIGY